MHPWGVPAWVRQFRELTEEELNSPECRERGGQQRIPSGLELALPEHALDCVPDRRRIEAEPNPRRQGSTISVNMERVHRVGFRKVPQRARRRGEYLVPTRTSLAPRTYDSRQTRVASKASGKPVIGVGFRRRDELHQAGHELTGRQASRGPRADVPPTAAGGCAGLVRYGVSGRRRCLTNGGLQRCRVLWIKEMAEEEIERVGETGPTVDSIVIGEFSDNQTRQVCSRRTHHRSLAIPQ